MLKKYLLVFAFFIILAGALFVLRGDEDTWFCQNNQWVKHGNPSAPMPDAGCGAAMKTPGFVKIISGSSTAIHRRLCLMPAAARR